MQILKNPTTALICCLIPFTSWGIYIAGLLAGMGCTGPVVLIADAKEKLAREILTEKGYI